MDEQNNVYETAEQNEVNTNPDSCETSELVPSGGGAVLGFLAGAVAGVVAAVVISRGKKKKKAKMEEGNEEKEVVDVECEEITEDAEQED